MLLLFDLKFPITDPVIVFTLVLFIILLAPILLKKIHIPSILGLIIAGMVVGPFGFNILERDSSINLFGTVGLQYIMFLAGLELDMNEFKKNKHRSIIFGLLTFSIPMAVGFPICYYVLHLDPIACTLVSSMFATHTMVAYPVASRLGLTKNEAVTISVGGTIVADTLVLVLLAVITGTTKGTLGTQFWIELGISFAIFLAIIFIGFPIIARWFLKKLEGERTAQYIFVMAMVFLAATLAELAGIEPIIGAFLAGLALNRLIPHSSHLMGRIEFVGSAFFIPFFLLMVGMMVDLRGVFTSKLAMTVAGVLTLVAIVTKWIASWAMQLIYKYSNVQRNLIFGLTSSRVAATLAVILVGYELNIVNEDILNGTILLILITCFIASFVTESAGRKLAVIESNTKPELPETHERILVPLANPSTVESRIDYALYISDKDAAIPIYPLAVVKDDAEAQTKLLESKSMLEKAVKHAAEYDRPVKVLTKVDLNVSTGIIRAVKDNLITHVIMGWVEKHGSDMFFGSILENLISGTGQMVSIVRFTQPLNTVKKVVLVVPRNAQLEEGFDRWTKKIKLLTKQCDADMTIYCHSDMNHRLKKAFVDTKPALQVTFKEFNDWADFLIISAEMKPDNMLVAVCARQGTISHNAHMDAVPSKIGKHFTNNNVIIIYPQQSIEVSHPLFESEGFELSPIHQNLDAINRFGRSVKNIFKS